MSRLNFFKDFLLTPSTHGMLKNVVNDPSIIRIIGAEAAGDPRKRVYFIAAHRFQQNQRPVP